MNSVIEAVNGAAETWWPYVLHVSWQSTVLADIVLFVVRFGRRMPAVVRSALVLIVQPALSWQNWWMLLHGLGTLLVGGWIALTAVRLRWLRRRSEVVDDGRIHDVFTSVARELKIRRTIGLRVTQNDIPPMAFGVVRPTVMLPASLLDELNAEELKTICAHELAHHRRWDPLLNFVQALILAIWWFNPLLWLLHRVAREVREDCCDDLILSRRLTTASIYCQMLVRMAERISESSQRRRLLGCAEPMHPVIARMLRVMDSSLPRTPRLSLRGFAAVLVVAALLLPGMSGLSGGPDKEEESAEPRQASESPPAETARHDLYGDPLPAGALLRLGTIRFRQNPASMHPGGGFLSDGTYVSRTWSGRFASWDVQTGRIDTELQGIDIGNRSLGHFQVLPEGETIATLSLRINRDKREYKQLQQLWDVSTGRVERIFETGAVQPKIVSIGPDDRWLVAAGASASGRSAPGSSCGNWTIRCIDPQSDAYNGA